MATSDSARAVWVDDTYDRATASDGRSRYGAYLSGRAHLFRDPDGTVVNDPAEFAELAFRIGCAPIMSPGYVRTHHRVRQVGWRGDDEQRLAVELALVAPPPAQIAGLLGSEWQDWETHRSGEDRRWVEPYDNDRPAAFTTLHLRIPINPAGLPGPAYSGTDATPALDTAKAAVRAVCQQINTHAGAVLAALEAGPGPGRGL